MDNGRKQWSDEFNEFVIYCLCFNEIFIATLRGFRNFVNDLQPADESFRILL